jgi:hypothetical protein
MGLTNDHMAACFFDLLWHDESGLTSLGRDLLRAASTEVVLVHYGEADPVPLKHLNGMAVQVVERIAGIVKHVENLRESKDYTVWVCSDADHGSVLPVETVVYGAIDAFRRDLVLAMAYLFHDSILALVSTARIESRSANAPVLAVGSDIVPERPVW